MRTVFLPLSAKNQRRQLANTFKHKGEEPKKTRKGIKNVVRVSLQQQQQQQQQC
jgi:hypothetical protein